MSHVAIRLAFDKCGLEEGIDLTPLLRLGVILRSKTIATGFFWAVGIRKLRGYRNIKHVNKNEHTKNAPVETIVHPRLSVARDKDHLCRNLHLSSVYLIMNMKSVVSCSIHVSFFVSMFSMQASQ